MKTVIESIFGVYVPIQSQTYVLDADGVIQTFSVVADGLAGVDWEYLAGVFLFGIVLYSVFRIVGTLFKG